MGKYDIYETTDKLMFAAILLAPLGLWQLFELLAWAGLKLLEIFGP